MRAHRNQRKLSAAHHLKHVQIAVAVAGIERLDGYGDQEIALSVMANSLSFRRVAYALGLFQRVGDVIGERGFLEYPLAVREDEPGNYQKQKRQNKFFAHNPSLQFAVRFALK